MNPIDLFDISDDGTKATWVQHPEMVFRYKDLVKLVKEMKKRQEEKEVANNEALIAEAERQGYEIFHCLGCYKEVGYIKDGEKEYFPFGCDCDYYRR